MQFTIQSISKPFVYATALADRGHEHVAARIGVEPTFNLALKRQPNPFVPVQVVASAPNAG